MLENPEFNDSDKIRKIINLLEHISPFDWYDVKYSENMSMNKIKMRIGEEISSETPELAIVSTEFEMNSGKTTAITLVGPKRMDYNRVNQLVEWLLEIVNEGSDK